jgi:hypothetical protein
MNSLTFRREDFKEFHVTGLLYNSKKRFKKVTTNWIYADRTNLWRGSVYGVLYNGKRKLLKRVYN